MKTKVINGVTVGYDAIYLLFNGGKDIYDRAIENLIQDIVFCGIEDIFESTDNCTDKEVAEIENNIESKSDLFRKYVTFYEDKITLDKTDDANDVVYNIPTSVDLHGFYIDCLAGK